MPLQICNWVACSSTGVHRALRLCFQYTALLAQSFAEVKTVVCLWIPVTDALSLGWAFLCGGLCFCIFSRGAVRGLKMGSPILVCVLLGPCPCLLGKPAQFRVAMPVQFQRKVSLLSLRQLRSFRKTPQPFCDRKSPLHICPQLINKSALMMSQVEGPSVTSTRPQGRPQWGNVEGTAEQCDAAAETAAPLQSLTCLSPPSPHSDSYQPLTSVISTHEHLLHLCPARTGAYSSAGDPSTVQVTQLLLAHGVAQGLATHPGLPGTPAQPGLTHEPRGSVEAMRICHCHDCYLRL